MTLQAGTPIGKYIVRRKLAEGGMAEIYLASVRGPEGFEKEVVIKRIRSFLSDDPEFVQMFIAEARLASRLNHANIVQIFDFDKHEDTFYIAMEYVRGRSLWDVRKRCREKMVAFPPTLVAQVGVDVARGLHYAHQIKERGKPVGLVHRDVTPHNVLLAWEGSVKLTDFGIAKAGNKLTSPGMLKGKFAYMSPEQSRGDEVDARTDVFALGIVLWEMLTGGRLFEGDSDVAVLRAVQQSNIAPPGRLNPDIHPDLDAVVMRALERDVNKRYQTAQELERALGQFILSHAKSVDDTDLAGFLHRLYSDELSEDGRDKTHASVMAPKWDAPPPSASPSRPQRKREPTEVMPSASGPRPAENPPSWDEDAHAATYVVDRSGTAEDTGRPKRETILLPPSARPGGPASAGEGGGPQRALSPTSVPATRQPAPDGSGSGDAARRAKGAERLAPSREAAPAPTANTAALPTEATVASFRPTVLERTEGAPASGESPAAARGRSPEQGAPVAEPRATTPERMVSTQAALARIRPSMGRRVGIVGGGVALVGIAVTVAVVTRRDAPEPISEPDAGVARKTVTPPAPPPTPVVVAEVDAGAPVDAGPQPTQVVDQNSGPADLVADAGSRLSGNVPHTNSGNGPKPPHDGDRREHTGTGILAIRAAPWATVFIDGELQGDVVGIRDFKLASGKYMVRLVHPKRTMDKVITVRDGHRQVIEFDLLNR